MIFRLTSRIFTVIDIANSKYVIKKGLFYYAFQEKFQTFFCKLRAFFSFCNTF